MPPSRLKGKELMLHFQKLHGDWSVNDERVLEREFRFANFREALAFANRVGEVAEGMNHHPDLFLTYGKVVLHISTHEIEGLSPLDFSLAQKVDELF